MGDHPDAKKASRKLSIRMITHIIIGVVMQMVSIVCISKKTGVGAIE